MPSLDPLIVGDEHRYYSFREGGMLGDIYADPGTSWCAPTARFISFLEAGG
jgi:hypothetical protein